MCLLSKDESKHVVSLRRTQTRHRSNTATIGGAYHKSEQNKNLRLYHKKKKPEER
jgi:hypothetical protein